MKELQNVSAALPVMVRVAEVRREVRALTDLAPFKEYLVGLDKLGTMASVATQTVADCGTQTD